MLTRAERHALSLRLAPLYAMLDTATGVAKQSLEADITAIVHDIISQVRARPVQANHERRATLRGAV